MILGILSDTHGRRTLAARAIERLVAEGCTYFIHCGDVGEGVLEMLPRDRSAFVFGNNDYDHVGMSDEAASLGLRCLRTGGVVTLDGKAVAVTHGDDARTLNAFVASGKVDYLLSGHTHVPHDLRVGRTRRINPGALHRAVMKSVVTLDLARDLLTLLRVDSD